MDFASYLRQYIACMSISSDDSMKNEMASARNFLLEFFHKHEILAKEVCCGGHAAVFAHTEYNDSLPTILIYGHYDVQPVDNTDDWICHPFALKEYNGRLYGRGASDNKGSHLAILCAIDDILSQKTLLNVNLEFLIEGEEEIGSATMPNILHSLRDEIHADFALVADTWSLNEENIVITTGLRGLVGCEVELISHDKDLHSGYGGCIVNPIRALANICSSLHFDNGQVAIEYFYDDVKIPTEFERQQISRLPLNDDDIANRLGVHSLQFPDDRYSFAETMRFLPSLEFHGISGGFNGSGIKTIIPGRASFKMSCRIVPDQSCEKIQKLLKGHLRALCPVGMKMNIKFEQSTNPYYIDVCNISNGVLKRAFSLSEKLIDDCFGSPPVYLREGGSIGIITMFHDILGVDSLLIGLSMTEDNIHSVNESVSIKMIDRARKFFRRFLLEF